MNEPSVYQEGNAWQRNRYAFMAEYNLKAGIKDFGHSVKGETRYLHLITDKDTFHNFLNEPEILDAVKKRFSDHKAGDYERVITNTVASQPCCFNLFVPLQKYPKMANRLFSELLNKKVEVDHIEIEFTPNKLVTLKGYELTGDESLGDQDLKRGTDADVAVFYNSGENRGAVLIEFKYIESEFSQCGSYKNDLNSRFREICDNNEFYQTLIAPNLLIKSKRTFCGYLKYDNWNLIEESKVFDKALIKNNSSCPFRFSGQQLWRNLLLAENVARHRNLDEFSFWVISPSENTFLWEKGGINVEEEFRSVLTSSGNEAFRKIDLNYFFAKIKALIDDEWMQGWSHKFEERYLTNS